VGPAQAPAILKKTMNARFAAVEIPTETIVLRAMMTFNVIINAMCKRGDRIAGIIIYE